MANARKIAMRALIEVEQNAAFSNITLDRLLNNSDLSAQDRSLATAIFYGVLDRSITLDYVLSGFVSSPFKKVSPICKTALRMALYQIMYMDRIPDSAAVNESVNLVKFSPERGKASFVNGVLRNILRNGIRLPQITDNISLQNLYSCPINIVNSLVSDYGFDNTVQILEHSLQAPPVTIRVNTTRINTLSLAKRFAFHGIEAIDGITPDSLHLNGALNLRELPEYREGLFHVQDTASQLSVKKLAPKAGERVLDVCAAPGGKSFTMAELMKNKGEILALDLHEHRVRLINDGARRLGIGIIETKCADSSALDESIGEFDAVLCDVPCSGLGVIRRKPEIKYKAVEEFSNLPPIQLSILQSAADRVKPSGRILYSTCTLRHAENEEIVRAFLDKNPDFSIQYEHTFLPHIDHTDGFYCALLGKE